jgi:hypothetical protein
VTRPMSLVVFAGLACACQRGGTEAPPAPAAASSPASGPASAAVAPGSAGPESGAAELPRLGLRLKLDPGAHIEDALVGEGVMIRGPALELLVEAAGPARPVTLESMRKDAESYHPQNVVTETLADGWVLTFDAEGGVGRNYWLEARRTLGDQAFFCEATTSKPELRDGALAACKRLTR